MLQQRISGLVPAVEHGDGLDHISAGLVITPHQCLDQGPVGQRHWIVRVTRYNCIAMLQGLVQPLQVDVFKATGCFHLGIW